MDYRSIVEEKRAKLEKIRKLRAENERSASGSLSFTPAPAATSNTKTTTERADKILQELVYDNKITEVIEKENAQQLHEVIPKREPENKPERLLYEKSIQTTDDWYLEIELEERQRQLEREIRQKVENDLRKKIEAEYKEKYEKMLQAEQENQQLRQQDMSLLSPKEAPAILSQDEANAERDSEYAHPVDVDSLSTSPTSLLTLPVPFSIDKVEGRSILYIDTSPFFPELLLVTYSEKSEASISDSVGILIVWNTIKNTVEFTFLSHSVINVAQFSKVKSNQVYGCGMNGFIYLWDFRSESRYPILQTESDYKSGNQHFQPIVQLYQNHDIDNNNHKTSMLITVSSDGLICFWQSDLISQTIKDSLKIKFPADHAYLEVSTMTVLPSDPGYLLVGTSFGYIYRINLFDNLNKKTGVDMEHIFFGHSQAPIMKISPVLSATSSLKSNVLHGLFLTCGLDFSIRIHKLETSPASKFANKERRMNDPKSRISAARSYMDSLTEEDEKYIQPLLILNTENFTMDADWRPNHIAQIASVDSMGKIELWDLCKNRMSPIYSVELSTVHRDLARVNKIRGSNENLEEELEMDNLDGDTTADITVDGSVEEVGLNRVVWNQDGSKLFVGGLNGVLYAFTCVNDLLKPDSNATLSQLKSILKI